IAGDHPKAIRAGRKTCVVCDAARIRIDPIRVVTIQAISEADSLGRAKVDRGVMDLQIFIRWPKHPGAIPWDIPVVRQNPLDVDRWWHLIRREMLRVDDRHPS